MIVAIIIPYTKRQISTKMLYYYEIIERQELYLDPRLRETTAENIAAEDRLYKNISKVCFIK